MKNKQKFNMRSKMKNVKQFLILIMVVFTITSCDFRKSDGGSITAVWGCDATNFGMMIEFGSSRDSKKIPYTLYILEENKYNDPIIKEFEIIGNAKSFSEWNECNIKFPFDTAKNWLFRYEGKNIPKNISFLYDTQNNIGDTLVFWDSVSNIKYNFKKKIMELP